jgi:hypothetical protein
MRVIINSHYYINIRLPEIVEFPASNSSCQNFHRLIVVCFAMYTNQLRKVENTDFYLDLTD